MINKLIIKIAITIIKFYQFFISPVIGQNCRYLPTCSEYTAKSLQRFGILKGLNLSLKRIARCHPMGSHGYDPVPKNLEKK